MTEARRAAEEIDARLHDSASPARTEIIAAIIDKHFPAPAAVEAWPNQRAGAPEPDTEEADALGCLCGPAMPLSQADYDLYPTCPIHGNTDLIRAEFDDLYCNVAQLLDGWHADGTAWSEWDTKVRHQLVSVGSKVKSLLAWQAALAHQASAQQGVGEGWRDIASAPKMKAILLFAVSDVAADGTARNWKMATGSWNTGYEDDEKWSPWEWDGRQLRPYDLQPTHWQPLPAAPGAAPSPAGERLTEEECEAMDSILLGSANLDYLDLSSCAETIAKALSRLTKTGGA